jgi:cell division protein FtsN
MARSKSGGIGGTALGLLALGFSSAVFGALVIGPRVNDWLGEDGPVKAKTIPSRTGPTKLEAEKDLEPRLQAQREARAVEEAKPEYTAANPKKVDGNDELPCEEEEATEQGAAATAEEEDGSTVYRVRVGRYKTREEAEKVRDEINKTGAASAVFLVGDTYRVQIGAYGTRARADEVAAELKARNYASEVDERKRAGQ